ncbi:OLC1v1012782C1 [Oldenlandia corymbosa var. corymbosa]|uniref:OLC1v1012782C1 n=1 Tax=Oldenlandia corymbosa var. corymbosa TaxID=529605 RepID=A0AAV1DWN9_OLDCO|nr:OLC1v1012782C1 [Oldenlandia corymbosa var. corymbosa]
MKKVGKGKQQLDERGVKQTKPSQPQQVAPLRVRISEKALDNGTEKKNSAAVGSSSGLTEKEKTTIFVDIRDPPPSRNITPT